MYENTLKYNPQIPKGIALLVYFFQEIETTDSKIISAKSMIKVKIMGKLKYSKNTGRGQRTGDPYVDRRCGEDRRKVYSIDYFLSGHRDRRLRRERRINVERRQDCVRVDDWSSICPEPLSQDDFIITPTDFNSKKDH